jgi:hypothetical protein
MPHHAEQLHMMHLEKTLNESLMNKAEVAYLCVELAFSELNLCAKAENVYFCGCVEYIFVFANSFCRCRKQAARSRRTSNSQARRKKICKHISLICYYH